MARSFAVWLVVAWLTLNVGCKMCDSPYDYCGPTLTGCDHDSCQPTVRAGSILSGPTEQTLSVEPVSGPVESVSEARLQAPEEVALLAPDTLPAEPPIRQRAARSYIE
jgi:hypothetical protein